MFLKIIVLFYGLLLCDTQFDGDPCTKDGLIGTCINIKSCSSAIEDLKRRKRPQICSFERADPIVCCIDRTPEFSIQAVVTAERPQTTAKPAQVSTESPSNSECPTISEYAPEKRKRISFQKCLEYQQKYVYPCDRSGKMSNQCHHNLDQLMSGNMASEYEFSHMVLLGYDDPRVGGVKWLGIGSIISEWYILTSGYGTYKNFRGQVKYVLINTLSLEDPKLPLNIYNAKNIITHPEFTNTSKYFDIALLELENSLNLSDKLVPACLSIDSIASKKAFISSWDVNNPAGFLTKQAVQEVPYEHCTSIHPENDKLIRGLDNKTQMCFDQNLQKHPCGFDDGSPVQLHEDDIKCMYMILGVSSFGKCASGDIPGVYTRISAYVPWIESIVWP